jgi:hypothetical protein
VERSLHPVTPKSYVFIRPNGMPLNQQFIDTTLRRLCLTAGIATPTGAMAHAMPYAILTDTNSRYATSQQPSSNSSLATTTHEPHLVTQEPTELT